MQVAEQINMYGSTFIVTGTKERTAPIFDTKAKALLYIDAHDVNVYLDALAKLVSHLQNEHKYNDNLLGRDVRRLAHILDVFHGKVTGWNIKKKQTLAKNLEAFAITLQLDKLNIILHNAQHQSLFNVIEFKEKTELMLKNLPLN